MQSRPSEASDICVNRLRFQNQLLSGQRVHDFKILCHLGKRLGQLVAADRAVAVEGEVGEQQAPLAPSQGILESLSVQLHDKTTA